MRNILNANITKTPYELGFANESNCDNEIELRFVTPALTNPYLEITKQDGSIENTNILEINNGQIIYDLPFSIYAAKGTISVRLRADGYDSDNIGFIIPEDLESTDNVIVKIDSNNYRIRKTTTYIPTGSGSVVVIKRWF